MDTVDWAAEMPRFRELALRQIERIGITDVEKRIRTERIINPTGWQNQFDLHLGATFSMAHSLDQMLHFRPHNRFEDVERWRRENDRLLARFRSRGRQMEHSALEIDLMPSGMEHLAQSGAGKQEEPRAQSGALLVKRRGLGGGFVEEGVVCDWSLDDKTVIQCDGLFSACDGRHDGGERKIRLPERGERGGGKQALRRPVVVDETEMGGNSGRMDR